MVTWVTVENHFNLWKLLRTNDIEPMLSSFPIYLKKSLTLYSSGSGNQDLGGEYSRSAFNIYGDVAVSRSGIQYNFKNPIVPSKIGDISVTRINRLNRYLNDRGATLVVAGYPIGNGTLTADVAEFNNFQKLLAERLECPVISNYVDYLFDYKYFYDTALHLNSEGAVIRTNQLISDLNRWKDSGQEAAPERDQYADIVTDTNLSHVSDIDSFLNILVSSKERYTILISAKQDVINAMTPKLLSHLKNLGVSADLEFGQGSNYATVIEQGKPTFEELQDDTIEVEGHFDNESMSYSIVSGGSQEKHTSAILLNGQEYCANTAGLKFVVYSNETHRVLDEANFDLCTPESAITQ